MSCHMLLHASEALDAAETLLNIGKRSEVFTDAPTEPENVRIIIKRAVWAAEIEKGIPANFMVKEIARKCGTRFDKYYYSPAGDCFRSIKEVLRATV